MPSQNNQPVIDGINKLNVRNKVLPVTAYDFSTFYTNIRHGKLKNLKTEKQFIAVTKFRATSIVDKNKFKTTFDKAILKQFCSSFFFNLVICYFDKSFEFPWFLI